MKADAVFEGGGVKGIALVGALWAAEQRGYTWENVAGTSVGAIVAALVAAGYCATEIRELMNELDFRKFKDNPLLGRIPLLGPVMSLVFFKGMHKGDYVEKWLRSKLVAKGIRTFGDLVVPAHRDNEQFKYRLRIIAADISRGKMLVLPQDIVDYGGQPDKLDIAAAVRMSISIPLFYRPVQWEYKREEGLSRSFIVDGGILSNYPVWLFDTPERADRPTFGFRLMAKRAIEISHRIRGPLSLITAVVNTMIEAHDRKHIQEADFARTIAIPTLGVKTTDFDLSRSRKEELFQSGAEAAKRFFDNWDFRAYLTSYRGDIS